VFDFLKIPGLQRTANALRCARDTIRPDLTGRPALREG
jgi:hypothetical protein